MKNTIEDFLNLLIQVNNKLDLIQPLLTLRENKSETETTDLIPIEKASTFLNLAVATLYGLVHRKQIPHMKRGKKLYFSKKELHSWIVSGKRKTEQEIQGDTNLFLTALKK